MTNRPDGGRRLRRVAHPRLWLSLAVTAYAIAFIALAFVYLVESPGVQFVALGLAAPASLIGLAMLNVWLRHSLRLQRIRLGRCAACNYDLTGNVSGVCPECGSTREAG